MLLLHAALAHAVTIEPGTPIDQAVALHVTNTGLAHLGDAVEGLVPRTLEVSDISGELACDEGDEQPLSYALDSLTLAIEPQDVELVARDGRLELNLYLALYSSEGMLEVAGDCTILADLDEQCSVELPVASLTVSLDLQLALVAGEVYVDASDPTLAISPIGNPLAPAGTDTDDSCLLSNAIGMLLGQDPDFISNLLVGLVEPELEGLGADIEEQLGDVFSELAFETDFEVGDGGVALELYPSDIVLDDSGMLLGFGAVVDTTNGISSCVPAGVGSEGTGEGWPALDDTAWDSSLTYDAGLLINRDFVDHLLWTVWASGALCIELEDLAGVPITADFLGGLFGESFGALFPDGGPALLATTSSQAPGVIFDDDVPQAIDLEGFGLNVVAELDGRETRIVQVGIEGEVGIDPGISLDAVSPAILLSEDDLDFTEPYNELVEPGYAEGLGPLVPVVVDSFLPEDLGSFAIPSFQGIGLDGVWWLPSDDDQWQGGFFVLDVSGAEPLELAGCSGGSFGCDGFEGDTGSEAFDFEDLLGCSSEDGGDCASGCESKDGGCEGGSCSTHGKRKVFWPGWRLAMAVFCLGLVARRRRR